MFRDSLLWMTSGTILRNCIGARNYNQVPQFTTNGCRRYQYTYDWLACATPASQFGAGYACSSLELNQSGSISNQIDLV